MVLVLAERAEDFILQSYKIHDVPLKLRPVSARSRDKPPILWRVRRAQRA